MNKFFLDLGKQPLANNFLSKYNSKQPSYRLKLYFDDTNKLVSISKRIPSNVMFDNKYPYKSSMSNTMRTSFKKLSKIIKKRFNPNLLLEIGSNDGALLKNFNKNKAIGIEPCKNLAKITKNNGYITYSRYWDKETANYLKRKHNNLDLIYSANTLTHISNLNDVFSSIIKVLSKNGILIIEDPSLLECLKKTSYDQFYNEHIYVFSALALKNILKKFNLEIFDIENLKTHGGSLRYFIKRKESKRFKISSKVKKQLQNEIRYGLDKFQTYKNFATRVKKSKKELLNILNDLKKKNKKIIGYGATAKAVTVLNYCNINNNLINNFTDITPEKVNKFLPGRYIKILKYNKKILNNYDYAFLGAWNFKSEILNKERKFVKKGFKFITHVPYPKIFN